MQDVIAQKKDELKGLAGLINFEATDENITELRSTLYNSDFITINEDDFETDREIKKLVRKTGIVKNDTDFYQLFYYFVIEFKNDKVVRLVLLNTEIPKFLDIVKRFIIDHSLFCEAQIVDKLNGFKFVSKTTLEDYKVFQYKSNFTRLLSSYDICHPAYKSMKLVGNKDDCHFTVVKSETMETLKVNNSKVNVVSNYLYLLKDLDIIRDFN